MRSRSPRRRRRQEVAGAWSAADPAARLGGVASAAVVPAVAQETTFRVDVKLVRMLATVKNAQGQLVGGLNKDDFTITDNGTPQASVMI